MVEPGGQAGMPEDDFPTMRAAFADALPDPKISLALHVRALLASSRG